MSLRPLDHSNDVTCPKRLWVLLSLCDDEGTEARGGAPASLVRAHLAYCESCRLMARSVAGVEAELSDLAQQRPTAGQMNAILKRGMAAAQSVHVEAASALQIETGESSTWRERLADRLINPRPVRFGGAERTIQLRHAVAASLAVLVVLGGTMIFRGQSALPNAGHLAAPRPEAVPWTYISTQPGRGPLSVWETKARSVFDRIPGWKSSPRPMDDGKLPIEFADHVTVSGGEGGGAEGQTHVSAERGLVRRPFHRGELVPASGVPVPVDKPGSAVLSKSLKDTR